MRIHYRPLGESKPPSRGTKKAAGYDLYTVEPVSLEPYKLTVIKTNLSIALPEGYALWIAPRSSLCKEGIMMPNSVGIIDEDYRGEIMILAIWIPHPYFAVGTQYNSDIGIQTLYKSEHANHHIDKGKRIAQALLVKCEEQEWVQVDSLPTTERGEGGFGSTGEK